MSKVLQATYHDGNLVLDEKLDPILEGQKVSLILIENPDSVSGSNSEIDMEERRQKFLEEAQKYSAKLPEDYKFDREEIYDRTCFHRL